MSYNFGLTIESLVAILLLLTIVYCARLNSRLEKLRADEQSMKATIGELLGATANAERAIAGLKQTLRECQDDLDKRLRDAQGFSAEIGNSLKAGEEVLARLRKVAHARDLFARADGDKGPSASLSASAAQAAAPADPKAIVAAAQALAARASSRVKGAAA